MRRVAAVEPELAGVFRTTGRWRRDSSLGFVPTFAVVVQRPEQGPVDIGRVAGALKIGAQARRRLRVDRQRVAPAALARDAQ